MKAVRINVEGWPEHFVQMIRAFADYLDKKARNNSGPQRSVELPLWPGVAYPPEKLRREEIYKDVC